MNHKLIVSVLSAIILTGAVTTTPVHAANSGNEVKMYRLYNPNSGEHFYTASTKERDHLDAIGWNYEGIGWIAPEKSSTPVYRLYNPNAGEHHYTTNANEKNHLINVGWKDEGIGWYSDDNKGVALLREYNPNKFSCNHNYTISEEEHNHLVSIGWRNEGTAWYGMVSDSCQVIHHDAVTQQKWVQDSPAYDTQEATGMWERCFCGKTFYCTGNQDTNPAGFQKMEYDLVDHCMAEHDGRVAYNEGITYQTVHHDATGHYETVTVTPAYTETKCQ